MNIEKTFFERVYEVVRKIPIGRVTSYGAIAKYLGTSVSARSVGWAMNASHNDDTIPSHRVVNRNGLLTGKHHFGGSNIMKKLTTFINTKLLHFHILPTLLYIKSEQKKRHTSKNWLLVKVSQFLSNLHETWSK